MSYSYATACRRPTAAEHRKRAIAIGERIGLHKDWPVSKRCAPPFVTVRVEPKVKRQG